MKTFATLDDKQKHILYLYGSKVRYAYHRPSKNQNACIVSYYSHSRYMLIKFEDNDEIKLAHQSSVVIPKETLDVL